MDLTKTHEPINKRINEHARRNHQPFYNSLLSFHTIDLID